MDKSLKLLRRKQTTNVRLRKMNSVHERILENKIRSLNINLSQVTKELRKEANNLKEEIKEYHPSDVSLPKINTVTQSTTVSRASSRTSRASESRSSCRSVSQEQTCHSCYYNPASSGGRCLHFPCFLPFTYNSLGIVPKHKTYSVLSNYRKFLQRCKDVRPATSKPIIHDDDTKSDDVTDYESRAPRTTTKEKIRGLKILVKEMKERNEMNKPRDWATNYGDPLPRRVLLNPVKV